MQNLRIVAVILEEAAGISGIYQRRHEAELKLNATEQNLARIDDVVEQLASQLLQLARQVRQALRYREIGEGLRSVEGQLLYRRWHEADTTKSRIERELIECTSSTVQAEAAVRSSVKVRETAEAALPALREEDAIAAAVTQRLFVQRDTLSDQEVQAIQLIETLTQRVAQLILDIDREGGLNRDAAETVARLEWEAKEIAKASEGHIETLADATGSANEAKQVLQDREIDLSEKTEDVARLAARHSSAQRLLEDNRKIQINSDAEAEKAGAAVVSSQSTLDQAELDFEIARRTEAQAEAAAQTAEVSFVVAEDARAETQALEADARAERSEAEGEMNALRAEAGALAKLVTRETSEDGQILDRLQVEHGFEKALGAALADDLRAPEVDADGPSGWTVLRPYDDEQSLPKGVTPLTQHLSVPDVLARRMSQIGLVDF